MAVNNVPIGIVRAGKTDEFVKLSEECSEICAKKDEAERKYIDISFNISKAHSGEFRGVLADYWERALIVEELSKRLVETACDMRVYRAQYDDMYTKLEAILHDGQATEA